MVKCIMFDLGDVIVRNNPEKACRKLARVCPHDDEVGWFAPPGVHRQMDTGKLTKRGLYRQAVRSLGLKGVSQRKFEEIYGNIFSNNVPVQKIARKLAEHYTLILVSNTDAIHFEYIRKHFPVLKLFRHHVVSYKVGYVKPQPQIFMAALKRAGCGASECVFIDDKEANVKGARKLGIRGIRFTTAAHLKSQLRKAGVKI